MCPARELAYQIRSEFDRFIKYLPNIKTAMFFGGTPVAEDKQVLRDEKPQVIVGTPGRLQELIQTKSLSLNNVKHFVLDECDQMLDQLRITPQLHQFPPHLFSSKVPPKLDPNFSYVLCIMSSSLITIRNEESRTKHLHGYPSWQASDDVLSHVAGTDPCGLQEIHAWRNSSPLLFTLLFFVSH